MSKRMWLIGVATAAVTVLSGCVVVPAHHGRHGGYGYYEGQHSGYYVRPAPPPRYYPYYGRRGW